MQHAFKVLVLSQREQMAYIPGAHTREAFSQRLPV